MSPGTGSLGAGFETVVLQGSLASHKLHVYHKNNCQLNKRVTNNYVLTL